MKNTTLATIIIILVVVVVGALFLTSRAGEKPGPTLSVPSDWKTFNDPALSVSFRYPAALSTKYINALDWPPKVQIIDAPFSCTGAGSETAQGGITEKKVINGRTYCITHETQGAAGSIYTMYAYATEINGKTPVFTFSLRAVQCANYDEPQKTECDTERAAFDIDSIIDKIMGTFQISKG